MKFPKGRCLADSLLLATWLLSSCGSGKTNLSQGLKLSIVINNKEAIADAAGHPDDNLFNRMLDSAFHKPGSAETGVRNFIAYYKEQKSDRPITSFFYSGDAAGFGSEEALISFLKTAIKVKQQRMDEVLKARCKAFLALEPAQVRIEHPTDNQLIVYIPGITDKAVLKPVLGNRSGLHFWETYNFEELGLNLIKLNKLLAEELAAKQPKKEIKGEESLQDIVNENKLQEAISSPLFGILTPATDAHGKSYGATWLGVCEPKDTATVNKLLTGPAAIKLFPADVKWIWGHLPGKKQKPEILTLYAIRIPSGGRSIISDEDIASARGDVQNGKLEISLEMSPIGKQKWSSMTRSNIGKGIAMELNHFIYSAPTVNEEIKGGRSSITGDFTEKEMDELVKVLNSGSFPLPFKVTHTEPYQK